jgi:membrane protein
VSGVVGSVGLALPAWTLLGTIKKVEDSFNFLWHVDHPRSFARRIAEYLSLLVVGPLLLVGFIGLSHAALDSAPMQEAAKSPLLQSLGIKLAPYVMVTAFFSGLYMFIPNTRVHWRPALIGALVGGVLWAAVGKMFTAFVFYSTRLTIVYAGFAFVVAALLWTYFGWLILLAGARLSFYIQNPTYLRLGLQELRLSSVELEQLTLKLMYFAGRTHVSGDRPWTVSRLAAELGLPGIAVAQIVATLERARLLIVTEDDELVPARDIGRIYVFEILEIARSQRSGHFAPRNVVIPSVDRLLATIDEARRVRCGDLTLRDIVEESPRPALTLAHRGGTLSD